MNNKQYSAKVTKINAEIEKLEAKINNIIDNEKEEMYSQLNDMHDKVYELNQSLKSLDRQQETRTWTSVDWQQWNLIANNID